MPRRLADGPQPARSYRLSCRGTRRRRRQRTGDGLGAAPWRASRMTSCCRRKTAPVVRQVEACPSPFSFCSCPFNGPLVRQGPLDQAARGRHGAKPDQRPNPSRTLRLLQNLGHETSGLHSGILGSIHVAERAAIRFRVHGLRRRGGRSVSALARPDHDSASACRTRRLRPHAPEVALAFKDAYRMLHQRIGVFTALPLGSLDQLTLQHKLKEIGRMQGATAKAAEPTWSRRSPSEAFRVVWNGHSSRRRCRLRDHGGQACGRQRRLGAAVQHAPDRRDPDRSDPHFRPSVGCALQSSRQHRHGIARGVGAEDGGDLYRRAGAGAILGVWAAHLMFELPLWQLSGRRVAAQANGSPKPLLHLDCC